MAGLLFWNGKPQLEAVLHDRVEAQGQPTLPGQIDHFAKYGYSWWMTGEAEVTDETRRELSLRMETSDQRR
jgi:hypothetical protein